MAQARRSVVRTVTVERAVAWVQRALTSMRRASSPRRGAWRRAGWLAFFSLAVFSAQAAPAAPDDYLAEHEPRRMALVIGNSAYPQLGALRSARLDAIKMEARLRLLGFQVARHMDVQTTSQLEDDILPAFRRSLQPGDIVLVYFSGHGFAHGRENFLALGAMGRTLRERDLGDAAVSVEALTHSLGRRAPGLVLMLVDACRTQVPLVIDGVREADSVAKSPVAGGLARDAGFNLITAYASRPGLPAYGSGSARTSLFTRHLLRQLGRDGREFGAMFNEVSARVREDSAERQQPGLFDWSESDLFLRPTRAQRARQREAWRLALGSRDPRLIARFASGHAGSRHAAAARRWLHDHPPAEVASAPYLETVARHAGGEQAKIVGGMLAEDGALPWQVSLGVARIDAADAAHFCGGTVLSARWIVTAAHCLVRTAPAQVLVAAGSNTLRAGMPRHRVVRIIVHPGFVGATFDKDIALLELAEPLPLGEAIQAIALADAADEDVHLADDAQLLASGWGATAMGGPTVTALHSVEVPFVERAQCNRALAYDGAITTDMLCAGLAAGALDACQGDSGGPLVSRREGVHTLVGIVSWGEGCALADKPGVYTRVAGFAGWARQCMADEAGCP